MPLRFITATERLAERNSKTTIGIAGPFGIGKTTLVTQLPPEETLFLDIEAGMKSVEAEFMGVHVPVRSWPDFQDVACLVGGPDPAAAHNDILSQGHYDHCIKSYGGFIDMSKIKYIFADSISDATQLCGTWAAQQPEAWTVERSGKPSVPNVQARYGLVGREAVRLLKHLQHAAAKSIIYVGKLEHHQDDETKRYEWRFVTEGGMARREIPYIVDNMITYDFFDYLETANTWMHNPGKGQHRVFVCKHPNPWGLPAKTRVSSIEMIEEPHLGKLIEKINAPSRAALDRITALPTSTKG